MLHGLHTVGLEDPLASCVAPQSRAVISQQLIGGSEPCWYSLIGHCPYVWRLVNEGETLKPTVLAELNLPIVYQNLARALSNIRLKQTRPAMHMGLLRYI